MCPDKKTLSAYFDGEVEPKWSRKIEAHLRGCSHCQGQLDQWQNLSDRINPFSESDLDASRLKVWDAISKGISIQRGTEEVSGGKVISLHSSKRYLFIPAAAAGFVLAIAGSWFFAERLNNSFSIIASSHKKLNESTTVVDDSTLLSKAVPSLSESVPYIPELSAVSSSIPPVRKESVMDNLELDQNIRQMFESLENEQDHSFWFKIPSQYDTSCEGTPDFVVEEE